MSTQMFPTDTWLLACARADISSFRMGLYTNDFTPYKGFDPAALDEATFSGYSRFDLTSGWDAGSIDGNGDATLTNVLRTWTKSGAVANATVYGVFYVVQGGINPICYAGRFSDGPYPMVVDGDAIRVTPVFSCSGPLF